MSGYGGRLFGSRGDTLWNYANGREADPVTKQRNRDNSYGNSATMPRTWPRPEDADATMLALCEFPSGGVCADGKTARAVTVQLVNNAARRTSHQTTLPNPDELHGPPHYVAIELDAPDVAAAPRAAGVVLAAGKDRRGQL